MTRPWLIYVRVSDDKQAEEGVSIQAQQEACRSYAAHRGWVVGGELVDDGYTGTTERRPGYQKVLRLIQERAIAGVITWKLKRMARSTLDTLTLMALLNKTGVELVTVVEKWDTTTPMGRAMVTVGAAFNQLESEENGVQTSAGMRYLRRHGFYTGGVVPAGCEVYDVDGHRKLRRGPDAEVVAQAWPSILAGDSLRTIALRFQAAGVRSPGRRWTTTAVRNLLLSGQVVGILVEAGAQQAVKGVLAQRGNPLRKSGTHPVRTVEPSPLLRLARCHLCGVGLVQVTATGNGGSYAWFRCSNRTKAACSAKDVRCDRVEAAVIEAIGQVFRDGTYQRDLAAEALAARGMAAEARDARAGLLSERERLEARMSDIALSGPRASDPAFAALVKPLGDRLGAVDQHLSKLHGLLAVAEVDEASIAHVLKRLGELVAALPASDRGQRQAVFRELLAGAAVAPDRVELTLWHPERATPLAGGEGGSYKSDCWLPDKHRLRTVKLTVMRGQVAPAKTST